LTTGGTTTDFGEFFFETSDAALLFPTDGTDFELVLLPSVAAAVDFFGVLIADVVIGDFDCFDDDLDAVDSITEGVSTETATGTTGTTFLARTPSLDEITFMLLVSLGTSEGVGTTVVPETVSLVKRTCLLVPFGSLPISPPEISPIDDILTEEDGGDFFFDDFVPPIEVLDEVEEDDRMLVRTGLGGIALELESEPRSDIDFPR
jgi:hypothetical protein